MFAEVKDLWFFYMKFKPRKKYKSIEEWKKDVDKLDFVNKQHRPVIPKVFNNKKNEV